MATVEETFNSRVSSIAALLLQQGQESVCNGDLIAAGRCFRKACEEAPNYAMSHNNLGWVLAQTGEVEEAIASFKTALRLDSNLVLTRVNLATLLSKSGRLAEAIPLWDGLRDEQLYDRQMVHDVIECALNSGNLQYAARWAEVSAKLLRGTGSVDSPTSNVEGGGETFFTVGKVTHDIEQIRYLKGIGIQNLNLDDMLVRYQAVLDSASKRGDTSRRLLLEEETSLIGDTYGKIWHIREASAGDLHDLWGGWDPAAVEEAYFQHPLGLCVIDEFLSEEALTELRKFCLESTIWFGNRYSHQRLGAFFREGFNCPLIIKLADELRELFPRLIGDHQKLLQLWAFKYRNQPTRNAHADFAAVNVNFWLTETEANLDGDRAASLSLIRRLRLTGALNRITATHLVLPSSFRTRERRACTSRIVQIERSSSTQTYFMPQHP